MGNQHPNKNLIQHEFIQSMYLDLCVSLGYKMLAHQCTVNNIIGLAKLDHPDPSIRDLSNKLKIFCDAQDFIDLNWLSTISGDRVDLEIGQLSTIKFKIEAESVVMNIMNIELTFVLSRGVLNHSVTIGNERIFFYSRISEDEISMMKQGASKINRKYICLKTRINEISNVGESSDIDIINKPINDTEVSRFFRKNTGPISTMVKEIKTDDMPRSEFRKILIFGETGSGKSLFVDTLKSCSDWDIKDDHTRFSSYEGFDQISNDTPNRYTDTSFRITTSDGVQHGITLTDTVGLGSYTDGGKLKRTFFEDGRTYKQVLLFKSLGRSQRSFIEDLKSFSGLFKKINKNQIILIITKAQGADDHFFQTQSKAIRGFFSNIGLSYSIEDPFTIYLIEQKHIYYRTFILKMMDDILLRNDQDFKIIDNSCVIS